MRRIARLGVLVVAAALGCNGNGNPMASAASQTAAPAATAGAPRTPPPVVTAKPPVPDTVRPDLFNGTPVIAQSLASPKHYGWPSVAGVTFQITLDTQPSGQVVDLSLTETYDRGATPQNTLLAKRVKTPYVGQVTATMDSYMFLVVTDPAGAGLTLQGLTVKPTKQLDSSSFTVVFHLAGDSFAGFGSFNDLATDADATAFFTDLVRRVNLLYAPTGIQIDSAHSGFDRISNAAVAAKVPGLVVNGVTFLETQTTDATSWGQFGLPATDASYGKSVDIFVVHDGSSADGATLGICECYVPMGGLFTGAGDGTFLVAPLFPQNGSPVVLDDLANTVAHELGHFLSLAHPTESDFKTADDLVDTPVAVAGSDPRADGGNIMCAVSGPNQTAWTQDQINAMRGFLAMRDH